MGKYKVMILACLSILVLLVAYGNLGQALSNRTSTYKETERIENILKKRMMIINDMLYHDVDYETTSEKIKTIEKGQLLESDLAILKDINENPTEFIFVHNLEIKRLNYKGTRQGVKLYDLGLVWHVTDYEGETLEYMEYTLETMEEKDQLFILKLEFFEVP